MEINWSAVREATLAMYKYFCVKTKYDGGFASMTRAVYQKYYRSSINRPKDGAMAGTVADANAAWPKAAKEAAYNPKSRWDNKLLQCRRDGQIIRLSAAAEIRDTDQIEAILHVARAGPMVSRIQIVVGAAWAGQSLYGAMVKWASSCSAVGQWKVMNPVLGSEGPDSAIMYLNRPLEDATVKALVIEAEQKLGAGLEELNPIPLGLMRLGKGIYGIDLPHPDQQINLLAMPKADCGSAGTIISAIICKAAWYAVRHLMHDEDQKRLAENNARAKTIGVEQYVAGVFEQILAKDLGWVLK